MSSPFNKPSEFTGGAYFKPAEHMADLALLLEPKRLDKNVPNDYQGVQSTRDEVITDITVFGTSEALESGEPSNILKDVRVTHGMLTSALERILDGAMVGVVRKIPTKRGSGFAFRDIEVAGVEDKVAAYYTKREAELAEALASVPSFE